MFVSLHVSVGTRVVNECNKRRQCVCCVYSQYQFACPRNVKQEMKVTNQMHAIQQCHQIQSVTLHNGTNNLKLTVCLVNAVTCVSGVNQLRYRCMW